MKQTKHTNERELLIELIERYRSLKKALQEFPKYEIGSRVIIEWQKCKYLSDDDMAVVAVEVLKKHEGKYSNAIECICELLTGKPESKWAIIDALELETCRVCTSCGHLMRCGYLVNDGEEYFCSDNCFLKKHTQEEMDEMTIDEDNSAAYWTEWEG